MENYQKAEQLVNKTGCSYEEAKAALEANGWDMIDAVISLEKEGKAGKETVEQKFEAAEDTLPEITPEVVSADSSRQSSDSHEEAAGKAGASEAGSKEKRGLWKRIKSIMMNNRMVVIKSNGQQIMNVPIIAPIIALLAFFWLTLILAIAAMAFGCRFHFEGEDLGKTGINNTMDKATDYAEKVKGNLTKKAKDEQNTDR